MSQAYEAMAAAKAAEHEQRKAVELEALLAKGVSKKKAALQAQALRPPSLPPPPDPEQEPLTSSGADLPM